MLVRQVPRVLEPDVASAAKDTLMFLVLLGGFLAPDLVHGLCQLPDNVELVKDQRCLRCPGSDRVDVGLPHIVADANQIGCPRCAKEIEEGC